MKAGKQVEVALKPKKTVHFGGFGVFVIVHL